MKKLLVSLLVGVALLFSGNLYAGDKNFHITDPGNPGPVQNPIRPKMPASYPIIASIDAETGELYVLFNSNMLSVEISISQNSIVYEDDTMSVISGQTVIYQLGSYDTGEYTLCIENDGNIIAQYTIVITED